MEWYSALTPHILDTANNNSAEKTYDEVMEQLGKNVVSLYKAILIYQMRSACSYGRSQGWNFLLQLAVWDDWNRALDSVKEAETELRARWELFDKKRATDLFEMMNNHLFHMGQSLKKFIEHQAENENNECLRHLCFVNPQDVMRDIKHNKETLIADVWKWILNERAYAAFQNWSESNDQSCKLLWIEASAGTGKTMLLIGIIHELSKQPEMLSPSLSYIFCQSKGKAKEPINNATAVMRSLIWMLLIQQPDLIPLWQKEYNTNSRDLFTHSTSKQTMYRIFTEMITRARPAYFVVDALDECEQGWETIISVISESISSPARVKWLVSSRPDLRLDTELKRLQGGNLLGSQTVMKLEIQNQSDRVNKYVEQKLSDLKRLDEKNTYTEPILKEISQKITQRAQDNLLWVHFLFKDLVRVRGPRALEKVQNYPLGLRELYEHKILKLEREYPELFECCKDVLLVVSHTFRPLNLDELEELVPGLPSDPNEVVEICNSFLEIHNETITLVHKSAKDYLTDPKSGFKGANFHGHADIFRSSIAILSSKLIDSNIWGLKQYGFKPEDLEPPNPDPLASITYCCEYWADHLYSMNDENPKFLRELIEDGNVLKFLEERFLYWLESLSLLGRLSVGVESIRKLLFIAQVCYIGRRL
jgi:hypothetical protein